MLLTAQFMLARFPVVAWRMPCAIAAAVFVGLNAILVEFGTIGQAYGICLFFSMLAFRIALITPARASLFIPFLCGAAACVAAGSSLLTAPLVPVLLLWIWRYDRVGLPFRKSLAFLAGCVVPFLPVVWLYFQGSRQTLFNVAQYHAFYRRVDWPGATFHDLRVFTSFLDSTQALTLLLLAAAGLVFIAKHSAWTRAVRAEFYLAAWIALAEGAYLCTPHPTFSRYYIFLAPFVTIVAMPGLYFTASKFGYELRPWWPAGLAAVLMALMFVKGGLESTENTSWPEYEKVARKVAEVTPKNGRIFADELVYFSLQQNPPPGMELSYSHVLRLPPAQEKLLHIVSEPELKEQIRRQEFDTVQSCSDPEMERLGLPGPYPNRVDIDDCTVFWRAPAK